MPGELYRHFKDKMYQIIAVATHSETREPYVVYQALYGDFRTYVRPYDMFISPVDTDKYPRVTQKYRFAYVGTHAMTETQAAEMSAEGISDVQAAEMSAEGIFDVQAAEMSAERISDMQAKREDASGINQNFLAFLDADSYAEKYEIVSDMEEELDDHLINQMAASIDVIIEDGKLPERIRELESCIRTKAKYELGRTR